MVSIANIFMQITPTLAQMAQEQDAPWSFGMNFASPFWLFLLCVAVFCVAVPAVIFLYLAQQKVAKKGVILALTAIRVALLVLILIVLVGPTIRWIHTTTS